MATTNGANGTSRSVATPENPSNLPPRFEIRRLEEKHIPWASAIVIASNMFCSPVWPLLYPEGKEQRAVSGIPACDYLIRHQVNSGMSFGVFDLEYKYKRPESEATEGALYWDENDKTATQQDLIDQMDFPLCSVAMSYDGINELDHEKMGPLIAVLPLFGNIYGIFQALDTRPEESYKPKGPKEMLMRNATSTKPDYEGHKLMKNLAQFLMRQARIEGYKHINIECLHDAVTYVWSHPPEPAKATIVAQFDLGTWEDKDETTGKMVKTFAPSKQVASKIQVDL